MTMRRFLTTLTVLCTLALIAYTAPWVIGKGVSMTFGAYDFAEWTSLHPASHAQNPTLLTPLLLRMPLGLLAVALAFGASHAATRRRVLLAVLIVVAAAALFPPLEFITVARDDPNFRQQATLSALTLVFGLIGVGGLARRFSRWIGAALAVVAAVAAVIGLVQGVALLQGFSVPATASSFGPLFALLCVGTAIVLSLSKVREAVP